MKNKMILLSILALVSFGAAYGISRMLAPKPAATPATAPAQESQADATSPENSEVPLTVAQETVKERRMDDLVRTLREKQDEYRKRQQEMDLREKRLAMAEDTLKRQAAELESVRMQLAAQAATVKEEQLKLQQSRLVVAEQEKANIKKTAAIYEKMEPASCVKIVEGMCANNQMDEAAKILHYMSERTAAKLLGEMTDTAMAAKLCEKLKSFSEG